MLAPLAIAYFLFAVFDTWLTYRRIKDYGVRVELSPAIQGLSRRFGVELGTLLGIMVPSAALIWLCMWTHFQVGLAILTGMRFKMFLLQLQSLKFEQQIRALKKELDKRNSGQ